MLSLNDKIAEITLIGTGGGYGESIVIHMGLNNWIVVDSCINPYSKTCLPLKYLEELGVNIEKDLKLVICSHWHDDHIAGISQLLKKGMNADFVMGHVSDRKKFLQMVTLDYEKCCYDATLSSTCELNRCLKI